MDEYLANQFCVRRELEESINFLKVDDVVVVVHEFDDTVAECLKYEAFKDVALIVRIF